MKLTLRSFGVLFLELLGRLVSLCLGFASGFALALPLSLPVRSDRAFPCRRPEGFMSGGALAPLLPCLKRTVLSQWALPWSLG